MSFMKNSLLLTILILSTQNLSAQDISLDLIAKEGAVEDSVWHWLDSAPLYYSITVKVCNEDRAETPLPENRVMAVIKSPSPTRVIFLDPVRYQNQFPTGWAVMSWSDTELTLSNETDNVPAGTCREIPLYFFAYSKGDGKVEGELKFINGTAPGLPTPGNDVSNDSSDQFITVEEGLPVTLVSFKAKKENQTSIFTWSTSSETNSDFFEIQRSMDGKLWTSIARIPANGESQSIRNYSYLDQSPEGGSNLYRLHMVDKDGSFAYSRVININFETESVSVYPNPATASFSILGNSGKTSDVLIRGLSGKLVHQQEWPSGGSKISVEKLSPGMYLVEIHERNGQRIERKIVVKDK